MSEYHYDNLIDKNIIPDDCIEFSCWECNLSKLPVLPDGLKSLGCGINKIIELPELPNGLYELFCHYNKIIELSKLPDGLEVLICYNNPIKFITPDIYSIMKRIYLTNKNDLNISDTIIYDNSGCSSFTEFFTI